MSRASTAVRPLSREIRERLGKLLPMLSSSHDGERMGAVSAIERVLKAGGLDWHDLTAAVVGVASPPPPPPPPPQPEYREYDDGKTASAVDVRDTVEAIRRKRKFGESAERFLDDLLMRADQYDTVYFTPRQWEFLRSLARQAGTNGSR